MEMIPLALWAVTTVGLAAFFWHRDRRKHEQREEKARQAEREARRAQYQKSEYERAFRQYAQQYMWMRYAAQAQRSQQARNNQYAELLNRLYGDAMRNAYARPAWFRTLGFTDSDTVTRGTISERFKALAMKAHPDKGGTTEAMSALIKARDEAMASLGH